MNVAITVWENRISPVFDSSRTLLVAAVENARAVNGRREPFNPAFPSRLVDRFNELEIETLICGAITRTPAALIEAGKIQLIPFICGGVDDVLESYAKGVDIMQKYLMPGCCGRRRGREKNCDTIFVRQERGITMPRGDGTGPRGQGGCRGEKGGQGRGAGGRGAGGGGKGAGRGAGQGAGKGAGRGVGQGSGQGAGQGSGRGAGQGSGRGSGQGGK
ncbi:MAG: hypothetical protein GY859_14955 [Desulfobacterales bacterium]|nr:hypothetical protein [Desulfobacterales bacterium]